MSQLIFTDRADYNSILFSSRYPDERIKELFVRLMARFKRGGVESTETITSASTAENSR
jgi:hypothetical protein